MQAANCTRPGFVMKSRVIVPQLRTPSDLFTQRAQRERRDRRENLLDFSADSAFSAWKDFAFFEVRIRRLVRAPEHRGSRQAAVCWRNLVWSPVMPVSVD